MSTEYESQAIFRAFPPRSECHCEEARRSNLLVFAEFLSLNQLHSPNLFPISTKLDKGIGGQITDCFVVPPRNDTFFLAVNCVKLRPTPSQRTKPNTFQFIRNVKPTHPFTSSFLLKKNIQLGNNEAANLNYYPTDCPKTEQLNPFFVKILRGLLFIKKFCLEKKIFNLYCTTLQQKQPCYDY